jgi:hypothetical protein
MEAPVHCAVSARFESSLSPAFPGIFSRRGPPAAEAAEKVLHIFCVRFILADVRPVRRTLSDQFVRLRRIESGSLDLQQTRTLRQQNASPSFYYIPLKLSSSV